MNETYKKQYDVVVAGGGVSGTAAAIASACAGADTLLVEQAGYLGGTLTSCGVAPMMTFFAGEKQVIYGLMQEIVDRMVQQGYSCGHVKDTTRYVSFVTPFESEGLKRVLDDMAAQSGCTVLFHSFIGGAITGNNRITGLKICNKDGLHDISAKVFIDATGDGDVMAWAGAEYKKGRPQDGASQPLTMKMKYCNVDTAALKGYIKEHLSDFPRLKNSLDLVDTNQPLSLAGFDSVFRKAKEDGELSIPREDILMFETSRPGEFVVNTTRILNCDATDAVSLSKAEMQGRRQCEELAKFFKNHVPGYEKAILEFTGPSVGIRGSRQLVGKYVLTSEDVLRAKKFDTAIAHSGYPIDIHSPDGEGTRTHYIGEGGGRAYYDIPYEIMVPKTIENLLVTGRCASASFEAQASIRLTPSAGSMGQAAGIAAALAAKGGLSVGQVDVAELQRLLRRNGAYIEG